MFRQTTHLIVLLALIGAAVFAGAGSSDARTASLFGQELSLEAGTGAGTGVEFCFLDNFNYVWRLTYSGEQIGPEAFLRGEVDVPACGLYYVTDMHDVIDDAFAMTAEKSSDGTDGCSAAFTYKGTYDEALERGTGVWVNMDEEGSSAGDAGTFILGAISCGGVQESATPAGAPPAGPSPAGTGR